jgi:hypothetical protein
MLNMSTGLTGYLIDLVINCNACKLIQIPRIIYTPHTMYFIKKQILHVFFKVYSVVYFTNKYYCSVLESVFQANGLVACEKKR